MNKRMLAVLILLAVAALACTCNLPFGPAQQTPAPPTQANVLFQDDFSNPASGWEVGDYDTGSAGYKDGVYAVISSNTTSTMWGVANRSFDNLVIEVDATQVSAGPTNDNDYGVICREQGDGNGYYLLVSGDGYYAILKGAGGEFEKLVDWTQSDAVRQGNATNHIKAVCNGSTLELSVNGQRLATASDSTFTQGDIALTTTTYEDVPSEVHFDNLAVSKP
jgi:hypothetical protein